MADSGLDRVQAAVPELPPWGAHDLGSMVIEMAVKVEIVVEGYPLREAFYDLRGGVPLVQHVASLFHRFFNKTPPTVRAMPGASSAEQGPSRDPNDYALWAPHGHFLTDEEWEQGLPQRNGWVVEGCTIQFKASPAASTGNVLQRLRSGEDAAVKQAVFSLKTSLMQLHFAEVFIEQGGVGALMRIATEPARPALQTYALQALRTALSWEVGVQRLLRLKGPEKLVRLLHAENPRVVAAALELLALLCVRADGFLLVHGAALSVGRERGEQSYRRLCSLVGECDDLDVKSSALLLINQLVRSAPDKKAKERLMYKLTRRLGLDRLLSSQLHLQEQDFRRQLEVYQLVCGTQIPGSWAEADLYRAKCERMASELKRLRVARHA